MQLERHLAVKGGQCPLSEVDCPFKPYGCSFVVSIYTLTLVLYIMHCHMLRYKRNLYVMCGGRATEESRMNNNDKDGALSLVALTLVR